VKQRRDLVCRDCAAGFTRRDFLLALLGGLVAAGTAACGPYYREPAWLERILYDRAAAARLGRVYLDSHPEDRDPDALVGAIEGAAGELPADPRQAIVSLQRQVRDEYARDAVVPVSGWVLSRTEARLYALAALAG
jgi:hypothetical protein